jgi:hypothetical protein
VSLLIIRKLTEDEIVALQAGDVLAVRRAVTECLSEEGERDEKIRITLEAILRCELAD